MMRAYLLTFVALSTLVACSGNATPQSSGSGSGGGTTTTTAATGGGGSGGMPSLGAPITAPSEQWTWVDFPDALCANGSPTGIGVNLTSKSSRVVIYLEGGGACWSDLTCYTIMSAANFSTGYTGTQFMSDATTLSAKGGFFDRTAAENPFKDYSYVFVPYCTGDIHAGNNVYKYPSGTAHHVGFANMTAFLQRIVPTFPGADRVILAGSSAGGFGAAYNWWQAQQYFGKVRVDLIDDSGTPMPPDIEAKGLGESAFRVPWNLAATFPPGCTGCATHLDALFGFYTTEFKDHRAALLSYTQDTVLPTFFGISQADFTTGLQEEISTYSAPSASFKVFTVAAMGHVLWGKPTLATNGVTLQQFVTEMVTDAKVWNSVQP